MSKKYISLSKESGSSIRIAKITKELIRCKGYTVYQMHHSTCSVMFFFVRRFKGTHITMYKFILEKNLLCFKYGKSFCIYTPSLEPFFIKLKNTLMYLLFNLKRMYSKYSPMFAKLQEQVVLYLDWTHNCIGVVLFFFVFYFMTRVQLGFFFIFAMASSIFDLNSHILSKYDKLDNFYFQLIDSRSWRCLSSIISYTV